MVALLNSIQEEFSKGRKNYIDTEAKTVTENIQGFFEQKKDDILINKKMEYAQIDYWVQGTVNEEIRTIFQNTFNIWRKSIEETFSKEEQEGIDDKTMRNIPFVMVSLMLGASLQYLIDEGKFDLDDYFQVAEEMILTACNKTK